MKGSGYGRAMTDGIDEIFDLFRRFGEDGYGEDLSLERHMLQSAAMAQSQCAPDSLIVAALLHDIGYFVAADLVRDDVATAAQHVGADHEAIGAIWLSRVFDEAVTGPIALHVGAKRYLCLRDPSYYTKLSDASRISLTVQGGPMSVAEAAIFSNHPAFEDALRLRLWDDGGKHLGAAAPSLETFRGLLKSTRRQQA